MASNYVRKERLQVKSVIQSAPLTLASLPSRPTQAGSAGRPEMLYTNHFICEFTNNLPLYQYDMLVEELGFKSGEWQEVKGRARCATIMQTLVSTGCFNPQWVVWSDEQRYLYSISILPTPQYITSQDGRQRVHLKSLTKTWFTNDLEEYIHHRATQYPYDAVRILETLLKKSIQDRMRVVNNTCYFTNEPAKPLAPGFEERLGFSQALQLGPQRITLNVQTKLTTFYCEMPLMEFIRAQLGHSNIPNQQECKRLNAMLKGCQLVTKQSNWTRVYEFDRFDHRTLERIPLDLAKNLKDYYTIDLNMTLQRLDYPCIQVYRLNDYDAACHLPVEVCRINGWQVYDKPLSKAQEANQPRKFIPKPGQRYDAIMSTLRQCQYNSSTNRLCSAVGFQVDQKEMFKVPSRILNQPQILTGPNYETTVRIGRIPLNGHLFTPKPISALAVAYFGTHFLPQKALIKSFVNNLLGVMRNFHVNVMFDVSEIQQVRPTIDQIDEFFHCMKSQDCQLVVCIMDGRQDEDLSELKTMIKTSGTIQHGL